MLNIFFSLFLLGMLIVLCGKAISRAMHQQQPLNSKEAALLIALSLGCSFCPERRRQRCLQNPAAFLLKRAQPGCRKCGSFFLYAKKRQTAGFCLAVCLLCCYFVLRSVAEIPIKAF